MNKIIRILIVSLVFAFSGNAQKQRTQKTVDFTPEQIATLQSKKMRLHLDLNESQQKELFNILKSETKERKVMMAKFKNRKKKGIKPTEAERFEFQNKRLDKQITRKAQLKKILTPEQYQKWQKMSAQKYRKRNFKNNKSRDGQNQRGNKPQRKY